MSSDQSLAPDGANSFAALGVPPDLVALLEERGITTPFPIQVAAVAEVMEGRDVCGRAPTGSGKTLAFGLGVVVRVAHARPKRPRALILAPTRELAAQIAKELEPLAAARGRSIGVVYGGVGFEPQRRALRRGIDILVACPGRLEDLINQHAVRLDGVDIVVIDEADRMADVGFLPAVRRLVDQTSEDRQVVLFSATLDGAIGALVREYQHDPVRHEIGSDTPDVSNVQHAFWCMNPGDRVGVTARVVSASGPTIIFCRTRHGAERVARDLGRVGTAAEAIHGGRSQRQRDYALAAFSRGSVRALVATDVAARGIHVDDVTCVVHFDPPADGSTYLHRSGRTARAGAHGIVVSLLSHDQAGAARKLRRDLRLPEADDSIQPASVGVDTSGSAARVVVLGAGSDSAPRPGSAPRSGPARRPTSNGRRPARVSDPTAPSSGRPARRPASGSDPTRSGTGRPARRRAR